MAPDDLMATVQPTRRCEGLLEVAEHQREHDREGAVKAANRVSHGGGVLGNAGCDPGMRQLEQERATRTEKQSGLPVDAPDHRAWSKDTLRLASRRGTDPVQLLLETVGSDWQVSHGFI